MLATYACRLSYDFQPCYKSLTCVCTQAVHYKPNSRKRKCPVQCQAEAQQDYRSRSKQDVRVLVAGSTGYIGKYVTKELIKRGYNVVAFAREKSGVGGKQSTDQTQKVAARLCSCAPSICYP